MAERKMVVQFGIKAKAGASRAGWHDLLLRLSLVSSAVILANAGKWSDDFNLEQNDDLLNTVSLAKIEEFGGSADNGKYQVVCSQSLSLSCR